MEKQISFFKDEFVFLSNFYSSPIIWRGTKWPTVEHAYQASKSKCPDYEERIRGAETPAIAKKLGQKAPLREDWEEVKVTIMTELVWLKFDQNRELGDKLLSTGSAKLVEGNYWHDNFWGGCFCHRCRNKEGKNMLGFILMEVRKYLGGEITFSSPSKANNNSGKIYPEDSPPYQIAKYLLDLILETHSNFQKGKFSTKGGKEKTIQSWAHSIDLMIRKDERDSGEIIEVITWAQDDPFWRKNIRSGDKLRLQYDRLLDEMRDNPKHWQLDDPDSELTDMIIRRYGYFIGRRDYVPLPDERVKFIQATIKMLEFYKDRSCQDRKVWVEDLFDYLSDKYESKGELVSPGHLCSEKAWRNDMCQYLKGLGVR